MFFSDRALGFSSNQTTWLPVNENYIYLNLQAQKDAERSHYKVYKQLTELRKEAAIQLGETQVAALSERVLAFTRYLPYFLYTYIDFNRYRLVILGRKVILLDWIGGKEMLTNFLS